MGMHIIVPVLLIALIVFVVVSLVTKKPEDRIIERFWGA
ncbi:MAG: sodium/pantothenate symporter, partial [Thermosediminibacterales bacterium]|nr:sodium/pantothenate symporter [Thermosediminibacterales bacterium]